MPLVPSIAILAIAIALGGLAAVWHDRAKRAIPPVRTFAVVAAASIAVLHLLPEAIAEVGWPALLAAAAGLLGPWLLERAVSPGGEHRHNAPTTALAMGYAAVIAHQAGEGATVATLAETGALSASIILAIAAHTMPLAMVVGMRVMKVREGRQGAKKATGLALAGVILATVGGAALGSVLGADQLATVEPWILATIAGLLLHALAHDAFPEPPVGALGRVFDATAGLAGLSLALIGVEDHGWSQEIPVWLQVLGVVVVAGAIVLRSLRRSKAGGGHVH